MLLICSALLPWNTLTQNHTSNTASILYIHFCTYVISWQQFSIQDLLLFPFARQIGWVTDAYLQDNRSEAMLASEPLSILINGVMGPLQMAEDKCVSGVKTPISGVTIPTYNSLCDPLGQNGTVLFFKHSTRCADFIYLFFCGPEVSVWHWNRDHWITNSSWQVLYRILGTQVHPSLGCQWESADCPGCRVCSAVGDIPQAGGDSGVGCQGEVMLLKWATNGTKVSDQFGVRLVVTNTISGLSANDHNFS